MPICKGAQQTKGFYKGNNLIVKIYKGATKVYEKITAVLKTYTGYPGILTGSVGQDMVGYTLHGNSTQSGTPSPTNTIPVESVGELVASGEHAGKYEIKFKDSTTGNELGSIYLDEPLRKIGTYADYIDFETQKVMRRIAYKTISYFGWNQSSSLGSLYRFESGYFTEKLFTGTYSTNLFCENLQVVTYGTRTDGSIAERHNYNYLMVLSSSFANAQQMISAIGDSKVYYVLATEREESITLPSIATLVGNNTVIVDTTSPSEMTIKYMGEA